MTSGRLAILAIAAYLIGAAFLTRVGPYADIAQRAGRFGPPEERPGVSPAAVSIFLGRLGEDGRALYARALVLDLAIPVLFVAAGWAVVTWIRERRPRPGWPTSLAVRVLILVAAAEAVENLLLYAALAGYPGDPPVGGLIGVAVSAKFALVSISVAWLAGLWIWSSSGRWLRRTAVPSERGPDR